MKEFEGLELEEIETSPKFGLIFWCGNESSQDICFQTESECNEVLQDILNGKGVDVTYSYNDKEIITLYPHRIMKVKFINKYRLPPQKIENLTPEVEFPENIGHHSYFPHLVKRT